MPRVSCTANNLLDRFRVGKTETEGNRHKRVHEFPHQEPFTIGQQEGIDMQTQQKLYHLVIDAPFSIKDLFDPSGVLFVQLFGR